MRRHRSHRHHRGHDRYDDDAGVLLRMAHGAALWLFIFLLVVSPLPMGANRDWAWSPMVVAVGAIAALCAFVGGARGGFEVRSAERTPLIVLLACFTIFLLIALLQMSSFAPATASAAFYARAREILGHAHAAVPSLAIDASFFILLKCLACALIFLVARALCRDERSARLLMWSFLVSATIVMAYAIYMHVTTHSCYLGSLLKKQGPYKPLFDRCLMSGTFVSPNNFACYLGMAVVASLALMFSGTPARSVDEDDEEYDGGGATWATGTNLALVAIALLCLGGMLISGSRGAFGATVAGAIALGYLLVRGRENPGIPLKRMILAGVSIGLVVGVIAGGSLIRKSVESSNNFNRVRIWIVSLETIRQSPWLGWGLGSYADIYTVNQPVDIIQPNDKAHSTPLEVFVEMGIPGGIAALLVALVPWWASLRGAWRRRRRRYLPAAGFAISGIAMLHSTIDFSLQIPAIAFMTSAFLGLGWAHAFDDDEVDNPDFTEDA